MAGSSGVARPRAAWPRRGWRLGLLAIALGLRVAGDTDAQIDFANGLFLRGLFQEAAEEYRGYLEEFPEGDHVSTALHRLGESEYAAQHYAEALAAFDRLVARPGLDDTLRQRGLLARGEVLYYLERLDDAAAVLTPLTAETSGPDVRARALYYLGKVHLDAGRADAAFAAFNTVVEELADHSLAPFARYQVAFVHLLRDDLENAAIAFSEVAAADVEETLRMECRFRAAETYDKIGWFSAAVKEYETLRTEFPNSDYARRAAYGYAWALYHAGKFAEAAVAASAFIEAQPDAPERVGMAYLRANCLQQQERFDDAVALYRQIQADHPDTEFALRARYKLAWVLYLSGKPGEAKKAVTAFLQSCKDDAMLGDAAFLLGTIEAAEGNYEDAYEEFRLVAEKYSGGEFGAEALYKAGECLAELGRTAEAAKVFENFAKAHPDHALVEQAILRVGDAQLSSAAFEDAVAKYQRILESPGDTGVVENTLYRLAITYHNMKNYEASAAAFQRLVEQFGESAHRAEAHFRIGDYRLRDCEDPLKSIEAYEAAFAADPQGPFAGRALKGLALARYETKDYDAATDLFLRLMTEFPTVPLNEATYAKVGQTCFDQGRWDDAAVAFGALLEANPDYPNPALVRFKIAECGEAAGKTAEAVALYRAVVDTAPSSAVAIEARYRMARLHEAQGQMDEAFRLYEETANTNTGDAAARARFRLGELYEGREDFSAAARSYMRVAILFFHEDLSPESLWRAGECFRKADSLQQARKTFQELLADYPDCEQAARAKEQLAQLDGTTATE